VALPDAELSGAAAAAAGLFGALATPKEKLPGAVVLPPAGALLLGAVAATAASAFFAAGEKDHAFTADGALLAGG
jgi:hypothetical protein